MNSLSRRLDDSEPPFAASTATAWMVGGLTVAIGAFCAFAAFVAPALFGPLVAFVIGTERILQASRTRDGALIAAWAALALAWFGFMAWMLDTLPVGNAKLHLYSAVLVALSAGCWTWSRVTSSPT